MKKLNKSHIGKLYYTDFKSKLKIFFNIQSLINSFRKEKQYISLLVNKFFHREYVLPVLNRINIETSSICNLSCGFCAYDKRNLDSHPKTIMTNDLFKNALEQAALMGYKRIGLTPTTGDAFMDKNFISKLEIIEKNSLIRDCYFYTNFIPCSEQQISSLFSIKKIFLLAISIYGNDQETFCQFTKGNEVGFKKLINNLKFLSHLLDSNKLHFEIRINQRCKEGFYLSEDNNELSTAIKNLANKDKISISHSYTHVYDNWGGKISQNDVKDFGVDLKEGWFRKVGPCTMIFSRLNIGANGTVNACHVRDADFTLNIGNIKERPLKEILSSKNKKYLSIINLHKSGNFPDVCKTCDVYSSIYQFPGKSNYIYAKTFNDASISLKDFDSLLVQRKNEIDMLK